MAENRQELVNFYEDKITAIQEPSGEVYAVIKDILKNIGFDVYKVENQRKAWKNDLVVSKGCKILPTLTNGGNQNAFCLNRKYIPLALAKIAITPTMQREQPEIVEKLIRYQEECADVLYKHFSRNVLPVDTPLTREEMASYFMYMMNTFSEYTKVLDRRDQEREVYLKSTAELLNTTISELKNIKAVAPALPGVIIEKQSVVNPLLKNTLSKNECSEWINRAWSRASLIGDRTGKTAVRVFGSIYDSIRKDVPFDDLYSEYCKTGVRCSKIGMCGNSDYLRQRVDKEFDILEHSNKLTKVDKVEPKKAWATPDCVKRIVERYADKNGLSYTHAYAVVYGIMDFTGKVNIKHDTVEYAKKIGVAKCSPAYYISQNPKMMELLKQVTEG